jgi:hypothetical protein
MAVLDPILPLAKMVVDFMIFSINYSAVSILVSIFELAFIDVSLLGDFAANALFNIILVYLTLVAVGLLL